MTITAHNSRRVARRALQRERTGHVLHRSGQMLVWASGLALAAGIPISIWGGGEAGLWVVGSLLGAGLVGGAAMALAVPRRLVSAAARVDEALRLEDRLSSALELEAAGHAEDAVFSQLAVQDAERRAGELTVAQAVPVRLTRDWMIWPALSAAAVAGVLLIPTLVRQANQSSPGEIARARDSIVRASQAFEEQLSPGEGVGEPADEQMQARLADIERELAEGRSTPERARTESAAALEERARELEVEARREEEQLTQALREIEPDPESSVSELADALRRSDFAGASEQMRELARAAQEMDDPSREALAEDLRSLAEQIRQAEQQSMAAGQEDDATDPEQAAGAPAPDANEPPADQPEEPSASQAEGTEPKGSEPETSRPEGAEPDVPPEQSTDQTSQEQTGSPDLSRPEQGLQEDGQQQERSPGEELSDRLNGVAEQIERDPQSLDQPEPKPGENRQPEPQSREGQQDPSGRPEKTGERQPGQQNGQQEQQQPGEESGEQPQPGQTPPGQEQTGGEQPGEQPPPGEEQGSREEGTGREGTSPDSKPRPGEQTPPEHQDQPTQQESGSSQQPPEQVGREQPQPRPGQEAPGTPTGEKPGEQGQPGDQQRPGDERNAGERPGPESLQPGTEAGDEQSNQQQGQGGSLSEMLDQLEKMDQRKLEALQKMARSEKLREAAQDLLDNASPEDLDRMRNLAGRFGREPMFDEPAPTDDWKPETELFDARGQGSDGNAPSRVIGAAEGTGAAPGRSIAGASRAEVAERLRDAAAGAERAIEGQSIPPRMRNYVRSVYRRFEESANKPPVQEGRDVDADSPD